MISQSLKIIVPEEYHLNRVDRFLTQSLELDLSRSYIQKLIREGRITVDGRNIKQNYKIKLDETITVEIPEPEILDLEPENIPVDILYQDEHIAVINKPPGLVVHPGPGNWNKTLVNALLYHLKDLSSIGGSIRPGIVHRLDKDTAGLMIIAKNDRAHQNLTEIFSSRNIIKIYDTIIVGKPDQIHDVIDRPIGRHPKYRHKMTILEEGREAVSEYTLKKIWNTGHEIFSHLKVRIYTGRTHQIRVHLSSMGNPIVGDPIYSKKWEKHKVPYLLLAATHLEFPHPMTSVPMDFSLPLPEHLTAFMGKLQRQSETIINNDLTNTLE